MMSFLRSLIWDKRKQTPCHVVFDRRKKMTMKEADAELARAIKQLGETVRAQSGNK